MRIPKIENYKNDSLIELVKIKFNDIPKLSNNEIITSEKEKIKLIKNIERVIRSSIEYKDYVKYLREYMDMTSCAFLPNVSNKESRRISIEIHHEPFTLYDLVQIVMDKHLMEGREMNISTISEEVMELHYSGMVGLIPLSITVHELVHNGKIFIPLQSIYGRKFIKFLELYNDYISKDLQDMLKIKFNLSKDLNSNDLSIIEKKFVYIEVEGMKLPQIVADIVEP